jgi:hypothetical protein
VAGSGLDLDYGSAAIQGVRNERMPAIVNGEFALAFAAQALAGSLEPHAKAAAVKLVAEGIGVLTANEQVVIACSLLDPELLPLAEITEGTLVPSEGHPTGLLALAHLTANTNLWLGAVSLNIS